MLLPPRRRPHPGEALDNTVRREVLEETGLNVTVERMLWLREYIGAHHGGAPEDHRVEVIFLCQPEGDTAQLGGHAEYDAQTGLEWVEGARIPRSNLLPGAGHAQAGRRGGRRAAHLTEGAGGRPEAP
ncbi:MULTISPECIES: NUDIX domain-containing protein [Streptomyces]|uniref:NUDIX domain-containing protein n=1 Tax=Streptomyces TaxID=1883 RepID=UPI00131CA907